MTPNPVPEVAAQPLTTAGHTQHLVSCPTCGSVHRHLDTGLRRGPCGGRYLVTDGPKGPGT